MTVDSTFRGLTVGGVPDPRVAGDRRRPWRLTAVGPAVGAEQVPGAQQPDSDRELERGPAHPCRGRGRGRPGRRQRSGSSTSCGRASTLPGFAATTAAEVKAQIPDERRRELFLESHRLFDTIRFKTPLIPAAGATFHAGGTYGNKKCLPLPDIERLNNPNMS